MEEIVIPINKAKLIRTIAGALLFVLLSIYLFWTSTRQTRFDPIFIKAIAVAGLLFFCSALVPLAIKLFDPSPGLIINEKGIFENTSLLSVGLIPWSDITATRMLQVYTTRSLLIYTIDPQRYLDKAKGLKRKMMQINYRKYGTSLVINSTLLKYDLAILENVLNDKLNRPKTDPTA